MIFPRGAVVAVAALAAGCGTTSGASPGPVGTTGSVAGHSFKATSAVAFFNVGTQSTGTDFSVVFTDGDGSCSNALTPQRSTAHLDLDLWKPTGGPLGPGTYTTGYVDGGLPPVRPGAYFHVFDATCGDQLYASSAGTLTINATVPKWEGSFEFTFPTGKLSGRFTVPVCADSSQPGNPHGCR